MHLSRAPVCYAPQSEIIILNVEIQLRNVSRAPGLGCDALIDISSANVQTAIKLNLTVSINLTANNKPDLVIRKHLITTTGFCERQDCDVCFNTCYMYTVCMSLCVYVSVYICLCTYIYIYICIHTHVCMCVCLSVCLHACMHIYIYIYIHKYI